MRMFLVVSVLAVLGAPACKKGGGSSSQTAAGSAPASTAEADALWALAPTGASIGVVISPRGVELLEAGSKTLRAYLASSSELAPAKAMLEGALDEIGGYDIALVDYGFDATRGAALFVTPDGEPVAILPVADRDRFLAKVGGTKGADADKISEATCKRIHGVYACVKLEATFAKLKGGGELRKRLDPLGTRGDLEVVATGLPFGDKPGSVIGIVQLARGSYVARAIVEPVPAGAVRMFVGSARPRSDKAAGFAVFDPRVALMDMQSSLSSQELAPGVTLGDVASSISGPLRLVAPSGVLGFDAELPVSDPAPMRKLLELCPMIPTSSTITATFAGGVCRASLPGNLRFDAWVDDKALRIGNKDGGWKGADVALTPLGKELASSEWGFAVWGRGTMFGSTSFPGLPPTLPPEALAAVSGMKILNELGIAMRVDGPKVHAVIGARSLFANPDDVVRPLLAVPAADVVAGRAGEQAKKVAAGAPGSPFAADLAAGQSGLLVPTAFVGMLAGIAVPAFMDYMKKSKKTEAALQLNKLAKNAKVYYVTIGNLPTGEVTVPATSCCTGQGARCPADPALWNHPIWKELDFTIDEPTLFRYGIKSDGKTLTASAVGDLDCDGREITYSLVVSTDGGNATAVITEPPRNTD